MATGRSDFPNQVNNSLCFPAIFRGTLDVRARTITDEMAIAASEAMASMAEEHGLSTDYILPRMDEREVFPRQAAAVAVKAVEQGLARLTTTYDEEFQRATEMITAAHEMTETLQRAGFVAEKPRQEE
jgi:malate dehydrogenase (oxaloacetate-decarboxylating)